MKTTTKNSTKNIQNLTSLWKTVGNIFNVYSKKSEFEFCEIQHSEWPNRIWGVPNITQNILESIQQKIATTNATITLPIWNELNTKQKMLLEHNGFVFIFEQIGMSLVLNQPLKTNGSILLKQVTNLDEAELWSTLFKESFGYAISTETIVKTCKSVCYYLAYDKNTAVGTAITHTTNKVVGIHSVGIPPAMRRKGYAAEIMKLLINTSLENNAELITLQASNMGKNIYLKLGFKEEFVIKNYRWIQQS
ncbi:GNAT family N-acetyltransferase [Wenyingzhuangia sp. 1_MG-2023]|nr:GNAT family N-acetyltransferase [Wenyingzhuangia sp. 1_MG-2023]